MSKNILIEAINKRLIVRVTYLTNKRKIITRRCIPFDIGPSTKFKDKTPRYHFFDLDSPRGAHVVLVLPERVIKLEMTKKIFNPAHYISWKTKWFIKRNWGEHS